MTDTLPPRALGPRPMTDPEFHRLQQVVLEQSGIWLSDAKRSLLVARIGKRVRELGLATYGAYDAIVRHRDGVSERIRLVEAVCTHETRFFREPSQFEFLERTLIPAWIAEARERRRPRRIRAWSAACSSGEEPFSLAMTLLYALRAESSAWQIEVLATDLSTRILDRAALATWPREAAGDVAPHFQRRFLRPGGANDHITATAEVREVIRFGRLNLDQGPFPFHMSFDVIFCRNALIYFHPERRQRAHRHLAECLAVGGHLFLGHAETVLGEGPDLTRVFPAVYRRGASRHAAR